MPSPTTVETRFSFVTSPPPDSVDIYPAVPSPTTVETRSALDTSPPPVAVEKYPAVPSPATVLARAGPKGIFVSWEPSPTK